LSPPASGIARPLQAAIDDLGQKTFVVDRFPPKANLVKLRGNFLVASVIECLGEAVALIRKAGIDPAQFLAILTGSLFAAPVYETCGELILQERYRPAGFTMPLGLKDMRGVLAAAGAKNVPMPVASLVRDHSSPAIARGETDLDWSAPARLAAENAGL
jgi:3-hydroxyisobutyrate dehydrogenase-like beta-hydroxyacid dehydrogenase